jgi:signal transduction histidine kinase
MTRTPQSPPDVDDDRSDDRDGGRDLPGPSWAALALLVGRSAEGLAVLDGDGRTVYLNPAGSALIGTTPTEAAGRRSPFADLPVGTTTAPGDLQVHIRPIPSTDQRTVHFRVRRALRRQRQVTAFANTAAAIARESALETVLDRLAAEVRTATGMATCAVVIMDGPGEQIRYVGRSGLPADYVELFEAARRNGAPMVTADAFRTGRTIVSPGTRERVLADERWAPAHDLARNSDWDTFVAAPLVVRGRAIGALNGFHTGGHQPDDEDVRFLSVMADHAAIAVDNARMFASLQLRAAEHERARLARDLHDSVNQALFSLTMQARGIELGAAAQHTDSDLAVQLTELRELAQGALREMRALIQFRRPAELRDEGLVRGLERLAAATSQRTGLPVRVLAHGETPVVDDHLEEDLFRLIQEAVNNVVKHAGATTADIVLENAEDSLVVEVIDDGAGLPEVMDPDAGGIGLATMRERAEHHGGRLELTRGAAGRGTRVRAVVPLPRAARAGEPR